MRIPVYFAHGNGFPSESYGELFNHLHHDFEISYLPMVGHGEYPITNNWPHLVQELIHHIKNQQNLPIVGLGHSMGGVLMYMAACESPELFQQIILLDSPLPGFWRSFLLKTVKQLRLAHQLMPIQSARTRRINFGSLEEAYEYFRTKPLFENFTRESLHLYVKYGLTKIEDGYTLRFHRHIETKLYLTLPDNLYRYQKPPHITSSLIYSVHSEIMTPYELNSMKNRYGFNLYPLYQGSHLFPFEYPQIAAEAIKKIILKDS